jgi:Amt family ammonium transporter
VAEDNEINQIVAVELLTKSGYECDVVDNGHKAVDAALSGRYDLVLMDSQMPEMDGLEAARIIRQREATDASTDGARRRIPIIALTANAIVGDRERCLKAGMDGYCSKPVNARQLLSMIGSLLKDQPVGAAPPQPPMPAATTATTSATTTATAPSDVPAILVDTLIERCMNDMATIDVVIKKFETQARRDVSQIQHGIEQQDLRTASRSAHALKGAAGILAADRVARIAAELERLGRQEQAQADEMQQQLAQLQQEVQRCIDYLPRLRSLAAERLSTESMRTDQKSDKNVAGEVV